MKIKSFLLIVLLAAPLFFQARVRAQDIPFFTNDFPPAEFAERRAKIYDAIGENLALVQGAPSPAGYTRFRQTNEFYYLCGLEVPHAYLLLDGRQRRAYVYLPHRNEARERGEGKVLAAEDSELVKQLSGIEQVFATETLSEHLAVFARSGQEETKIYVPFSPPEGFAVSRDSVGRMNTDMFSDPWDGSASREGNFINLLKTRFPQFEVKDLTPALDRLRLIKSPREIALIKKATRLSGLALMEAMRSTAPGIQESELDAVAKFVYYRNGAQGDAYYSLIASGSNAWYPHYNAGKRTMRDGDFLLMDYAPDVGFYMSDVTRMFPVNGKFSPWQRELYSFYLDCYKAILKNIKPGLTPQAVKQAAVPEMNQALARAKFSKPIYEKAARAFVENYAAGAKSAKTSLGHWIGMATHDVGGYDGSPLREGMVFSIEPALRVEEEKIYIRLEDVIIISRTGAEVLTTFVPMEIDDIEKLMREEGMLQRYPKDGN